jgi:hypothetical protein
MEKSLRELFNSPEFAGKIRTSVYPSCGCSPLFNGCLCENVMCNTCGRTVPRDTTYMTASMVYKVGPEGPMVRRYVCPNWDLVFPVPEFDTCSFVFTRSCVDVETCKAERDKENGTQ